MTEYFQIVIKTVDGNEYKFGCFTEEKADYMLEDIPLFDWVSVGDKKSEHFIKVKVSYIVSLHKVFIGEH